MKALFLDENKNVYISNKPIEALDMASNFTFLPVSELPNQDTLPDPFIGPNGQHVQSHKDWPAQREYLKEMLAHYMYGQMPPRPSAEQVTIKKTFAEPAFDGLGIQEHFTLTITRNRKQTHLNIALFRPPAIKRYPIIIKNCRVLFDIGPNSALARMQQIATYDIAAAQEALKRGYILCKFTREQLANTPKKRKIGKPF